MWFCCWRFWFRPGPCVFHTQNTKIGIPEFENFSGYVQYWKVIGMSENPRSDEIWGLVPLTAVSMKLPTFWTDSPEVWFLQAEAEVENKRINLSRTRFTHCVGTRPQDVACRLLELVGAPPAEPYEALRKPLIQMYFLCEINFQRYQARQSLLLMSDQWLSELTD